MLTIYEAGFQLLEYPPYSPDLAPSDFRLFPKLEEHLQKNIFRDAIEMLHIAGTSALELKKDMLKIILIIVEILFWL